MAPRRAGWAASLTRKIEGLPLGFADAPLQAVATWATSLRAGGVRADRILHGTFLGHPLHPALSDLPIGFWTSSVVCDLTGQPDAAGVLTAAGAVSSAATALTGAADWSTTIDRDRRLGLAHGLLNLATLGVELGSLAARVAGRRGLARTLNVAGLTAGGVSAWIGGELVSSRAIGVDATAHLQGPEDWTPIMSEADLAIGATRGADVAGRRVLVHRTADTVVAIENTCAHAGGPLDEGEIGDGTVTCPWHGSCFRLSDGAVLSGPSAFPQPVLEARLAGGRIEVRVPAG